MDKSGIEAIAGLAVAKESASSLDGAVLVPSSYKIEPTEFLEPVPNFFRGLFTTAFLSEFCNYINENGHSNTGLFVDPANMVTQAIIDMGDHLNPQWGKHRVKIKLEEKTAYRQLILKDGKALSQQDLIDFIEDWRAEITFHDEAALAFDFSKALQSIRALKIESINASDHHIGNLSTSHSALESIEIKSAGQKLPFGFVFKTSPYEQFEEQSFFCQLRALNHDKTVQLKFRIMELEKIKEAMANDFKKKIIDGITAEGISIYIGEMAYQ